MPRDENQSCVSLKCCVSLKFCRFFSYVFRNFIAEPGSLGGVGSTMCCCAEANISCCMEAKLWHWIYFEKLVLLQITQKTFRIHELMRIKYYLEFQVRSFALLCWCLVPRQCVYVGVDSLLKLVPGILNPPVLM